ncbi:MAG: hypothetical protein PWQ41_184 [Bacillota bacterium]|nr:hypothetical protein [Bacillota bacterium]
MVGIVIVSHSAEVAEGTKKLAQQMTPPELPLAAAGGTRDGRLGTDTTLIQEAIESVAGPDGVVVLADLGSAVLSTEMALELLPAEVRERVVLADAPLVEGAVAAAVESSLGKSLLEVKAAAEAARNLSKVS